MANNDSYAGQLIDEINRLKKDNERMSIYLELAIGLLDRVNQLKEQIDKMKCCFNCRYHDTGNCKLSPDDWTYCDANWVCSKWEMKE